MITLMMNQDNYTPKSLAELLNLRYQWEELVNNYKINDTNGTISNLEWFTKYGMRSNRFRPNFEDAMNIAKEIINEVKKYENSNLSGVYG